MMCLSVVTAAEAADEDERQTSSELLDTRTYMFKSHTRGTHDSSHTVNERQPVINQRPYQSKLTSKYIGSVGSYPGVLHVYSQVLLSFRPKIQTTREGCEEFGDNEGGILMFLTVLLLTRSSCPG